MTPQELKNSILQLAIQGKLVEQRPEEGTGEELYQQIQAEKQRLIKAGTIKKEKPLAEITEDEKPFDLPESWKWVRLCEVFDVRDGTHDTPKYVPVGIPLVTSKNLVGGIIDFETTKLISIEDSKTINTRSAVDDGDILFAMIGTIGNPVLVKKDREFSIKNMALFKAINQNMINMEYFFMFLQNEQYVMKKKANGGVQVFVPLNFLRSYLFPLPPLAEQKRIVSKIEELLPYIDRYEQAWSKLENFNKRFPTDMQKSILQMAIQGKLVAQSPEDGTGEELYQQIQAEKQRLIKAGTIKKEKPLPEIMEDEKPFDIPDSWKWIRMRDITENIGDGIHGTPEFEPKGGYYFINGNNLDDGKISFKADTQQVNEFQYEKYKKPLTLNSILISINGTIGNIAYYNNEPVILGKSACYIALIKCVHKNYIRTLLESQFFLDYASREATQTTIKNVSLKAVRMLPVPLPPLAEQKRIVAKLKEILPLCEKLKK